MCGHNVVLDSGAIPSILHILQIETIAGQQDEIGVDTAHQDSQLGICLIQLHHCMTTTIVTTTIIIVITTTVIVIVIVVHVGTTEDPSL